MQLPTLNHLLLEQQQGTLTITLNRPSVRNAMSLAMIHELLSVLALAEADAGVRVLVMRGAGGHFCAGADIKDLAAARTRPAADGQDPVAETNAMFGRLCLAYARTPLPLVCLLEGSVMGGGFGLACVSDISIASTTTVFALPETSLGVVPAQIAPFLVERLGYSQAKRLAISGGKLSAAAAFAIGLVHEVHDSTATLEQALESTLDTLYKCAPNATRLTKQLMQRARSEAPETLIDHAASVFSGALKSAEGHEGTLAFMQKRKPRWAERG
jgi:isohexenylglutaconyl-CoA hydratase